MLYLLFVNISGKRWLSLIQSIFLKIRKEKHLSLILLYIFNVIWNLTKINLILSQKKTPNIVNKKNGPLMNFAWVFIFFDHIRA